MVKTKSGLRTNSVASPRRIDCDAAQQTPAVRVRLGKRMPKPVDKRGAKA